MALDKINRKFKNYSDVKFAFWHSRIQALQLREQTEILILGCGIWGMALYKELNKYKDIKIKGFCDNNKLLQGKMIDSYPIYSVEEGVRNYPDVFYVIAIDKYANIVSKQLIELGIKKNQIRIFDTYNSKQMEREYFSERLNEQYFMDESEVFEPQIPVVKSVLSEDGRDFRVHIDERLANTLDQEIDPFAEDVMEQYEKSYGKYRKIKDISVDGDGKTTLKIMIACCHKDKEKLSEDNAMYYTPIQVGKALTDICLYDLCDNTGDNISERNYNYSETTALYWAWKNGFASDAEYIGLRHYRRKFDITDEQLCHLKENGIDIIHVEPVYYDSIHDSFVSFTKKEKDWELMKLLIKEKFPNYYPTMLAYENQHFICAYNMTIMRRAIFDEYCEFMFGILTEIEDYYLRIIDRRDRYLGYLAENLTSIFLMHHKDDYRKVIAKLIPLVAW